MFTQRIEVYDMKTIEIISGSQKAQFTTKSVTLNGREYFYINMSDSTASIHLFMTVK